MTIETPVSNLEHWLAPFVTIVVRAQAENISLPGVQYKRVVQETGQALAPVTVAMTTRAPSAKEKFRERHVVLVSPIFIIPVCEPDPNSVQVNCEGKSSAMDTKSQASLESYFGDTVAVVGLS